MAERMSRLGTETAFAVSAEANEWRALGHTVYPFHLGDLDLESQIESGENDFLLDFDAIEAAITPPTKLLIFNEIHNPTGAECPGEEIAALADLALREGLGRLKEWAQ